MFFKIGVLKNLQYSERKTPVLEPLFDKVADLQLSCETFNRFFHNTPPLDASKKFVNFPGKHRWQGCNRLLFFNKYNWIRQYVSILLTVVDISILHFLENSLAVQSQRLEANGFPFLIVKIVLLFHYFLIFVNTN